MFGSFRSIAALALLLLVSWSPITSAQHSGGGGGDAVGGLPRQVFITPDVVDFLVYSGYQVVQSNGLTMITDWTTGGYAATSGGAGSSGVMPPVVMITEWESPSGTQKVITPKKPHESYSNHAWRHGAAVNALLNVEPSISDFTVEGPDAGLFGTSRAAGSTMIASWTSNDGTLRHEVRTEPKEGESVAEQAQRHGQSVKALQVVFPADKNMTPPKTGYMFEKRLEGLRLVA